ncbi:MAG: hypothetical protein JWO53_903 [Chlamydiia bacterium]|nr:hypothetical protein [Chlamydiia bacterium]
MRVFKYVSIALGLWLAVTPYMVEEKSQAMAVSDSLSGILVMLFGALSFRPGVTAIGLWLQLAPLIFWAPAAASYLNDTLIGALLIIVSFILPEYGVIEKGPEIPQGASHNPSTWNRRTLVALLAFAAFLSARYMASFQLGYITTVWDPVFDRGLGTFDVITSFISKGFPVSDAGLGSVAYLLEALLALKGGEKRWHTMPWIVACFGFLVIPVGIVSIILICLQPLVVGHYCFWCLLTAFFMFCMIFITFDEVFASIRFVREELARAKDKSFWKIFWHGSTFTIGNK